MEFNVTLPHLLAFALSAYAATAFFKGGRLLRVVGWLALWQLLTPVRPWYGDVPLMATGFVIAEWLYLRLKGR